jgi:hypothetical protein
LINIFINLSKRENKIKYYQSYEHYPSIPKDIEEEIVQFTEHYIAQDTPIPIAYNGYDNKNEKSLSYVNPKKILKKSGTIGFILLPQNIIDNIKYYYTNLDHPLKEKRYYCVQVALGADHIPPHVDNVEERGPGLLYLIKAGGPNVRTIWYKIKDEFKHLQIAYNKGIPYERLIVMENHHLKERTWNWMNFSEPHSVENQDSLRIAVYPNDDDPITTYNRAMKNIGQ